MDTTVLYDDLTALRHFYQANPLESCLLNDEFSAQNTFDFFVTLAYNTQDIGRCISLMINVVTLTTLKQFNTSFYNQYAKEITSGRLITSICNNEALNHGSNLNGMASYIKPNEDQSFDIHIDKRIITNVGASDLLFISLPVKTEQDNKFMVLLFEGHELPQRCVSNQLNGLYSCPTGGVKINLDNYKGIRVVSDTRKSLFVMRHMYNMERFLLGCIMTGILKKLLHYSFDEKDQDSLGKFNNQYLQDKVIKIFDSYIKLDSLVKQCIQLMTQNKPIESILSVIKMACINDVHEAILLYKELCGGKSYFKNHISSKLLIDHESISNLGGTRELMKQTLFQDLQNKKSRS